MPAATENRQAIIDRFGEVDRLLRLWQPQTNPYQAEHQELQGQILSWSEDTPAEKADVHTGKAYQVEVTAKGFQRKFSPAALADAFRRLKRIKSLDPLQFFSITLDQAKQHLGGSWLDLNVPKLQTGPRKVNVVALHEAKPLKKAAA